MLGKMNSYISRSMPQYFGVVPTLPSTRFGIPVKSPKNYLENVKHLFLIPVRSIDPCATFSHKSKVATRSRARMDGWLGSLSKYIAIYAKKDYDVYCEDVCATIPFRFTVVCM